MEQFQFGARDIEHGIERRTMKKIRVRFISGSYGGDLQPDNLNDRQLGDSQYHGGRGIPYASNFYTKEVNLEYYIIKDEERYPEIVNVKYYGTLENSELESNQRKTTRAKQTDHRTITMFRGESIEVPHKKRNWTKLPIKQLGKNNDLTQDVFDMIDKSYGTPRWISGLQETFDHHWPPNGLRGYDKEPDFDAVRFSKLRSQKTPEVPLMDPRVNKEDDIIKTAKMLDKRVTTQKWAAIVYIMIKRKGVPGTDENPPKTSAR